MMFPQCKIVFEEVPHKFLYQEKKTSLGEGCLSKQTDQNELVRDSRTETQSSLHWFMCYAVCYFANCFICRATCLHRLQFLCPSYTVLSLVPCAEAFLCFSIPAPSFLSSPWASTTAPPFHQPLTSPGQLYHCIRLRIKLCFHMLHCRYPLFLPPILTVGISGPSMWQECW